jgi:hypothetical protein
MHYEQGFALLVVLVTLVALSLMIVAVMAATRGYTNQTVSHLTALRLRAGLAGATATIGYDLSNPALQGALATSKGIDIGPVAVKIAVRPEVAKVDINMADPKLIEQMLRVSGLKQTFAHRIAYEIADWRGSAQKAQPHTVQAGDYVAAGRDYMPPHRNFETLSDLGLLLDGNSDLVSCLEPDITLYTHTKDIDLSAASLRVRQAAQILAPSTKIRANSASSVGVLGSSYGRPDIYEITEVASDKASHMTVSRQVVLRITGAPHDPFWILAVTSPAPNMNEEKLACERLENREAS